MPDLTPEALALILARAHAKWAGYPMRDDLALADIERADLYEAMAADALTALRGGQEAMRERAAEKVQNCLWGEHWFSGDDAVDPSDLADAIRALPLYAPTEPHKSVLNGNEAADTVRAQIEALHREACRVLSNTPDSLHAQGFEAGLQRAMMVARGVGDAPAVDPVAEAARVRSQAIRDFCDKAGITPIQEVKGLPDDVKRWRMERTVAARRAGIAQENRHE